MSPVLITMIHNIVNAVLHTHCLKKTLLFYIIKHLNFRIQTYTTLQKNRKLTNKYVPSATLLLPQRQSLIFYITNQLLLAPNRFAIPNTPCIGCTYMTHFAKISQFFGRPVS